MQPPFHRLEEFVPLTPQDVEITQSWTLSRRKILRGQVIRREGDEVGGVFFLMEGWVGSSIMLRNGRRQIVKLNLPGDILGFPSLALMVSGETLEALTDAVVSSISSAALGKMFAESPRLAVGLFLSTQRERVALMQKLSWIGATSALERLAAFLLDLHDRLVATDAVTDGGFDFPITQQQLGDLLGLTTVHVNRSLRRLDETGCLQRSRGRIFIRNLQGLRALAPNLPPRFAGHEAWSRLGRPHRYEA
ncbi:Crp/Fnr family transcriptional regulator [Sphingobium chlorophenolicum]|uniref:Transcriptional regulator, Crp/Fnr family n=1 Tax=Sphingobium chlorophenolicum TaxID=46429 RepID=A0A081RE35_SPHCR|nr:Crp/Fnr family transcriptional regulator [Sphingobium chlorophenolicum]KEQ53458.1 Transcriptional regulator, Crp/Fnr family [Sphingobium chlorophenolicum]